MVRTHAPKADIGRHTALALRSLSRFGKLSETDEMHIRKAVSEAELDGSATELVAETEALNRARILLSGWAARIRVLSDGRRQILGFLLPGDVFGVAARPCGASLSSIIALTQVTTAVSPALSEAAHRGPILSDGLSVTAWCSLRLEEAYLLNQITRVGRLTAYERVAHLIMEIFHRLKAVSYVQGNSFVLPLTQEILADALGLSVVHTNRTLQQLRRDKLIEMQGQAVNIPNPDALASVCDFRHPFLSEHHFSMIGK